VEETNPDTTEASEPALDVMLYVRALWRRKWLVLGLTVLVALGGTLHTLRQPKVYAAGTSLIIDVAAPRILDTEVEEVMGDERSNYWANKEYYQTQSEVITSHAVAERVVDRLGLRMDAGFLGLEHLQDAEARKQAMAGADAVGLVRSRIAVIPSPTSRVLRITVEDRDPKRAALLANEVAEAYIAENLALRLRTMAHASAWLEERLGELESRARNSELDVYRFKRSEDLLTLPTGRADNPEPQQSTARKAYDSYSVELIDVRKSIAALGARLDAIQQLRKSANPQDVHWASALGEATEPSIRDLRSRLLEQRSTCVALAERYLPEHPKMQECHQKQELLTAELRLSLENIVRAAEMELGRAQAHERRLLKLVAEAKTEAFQVSEKEIEYQKLLREAENDQRLYDMVLKRLKEMELSGLLRTSNVRVLDPARPNFTPVRPNTRSAVVLFVLLGLLAGMGLVVGWEYLRTQKAARVDGQTSG
jgi:uncharacterized protein involved in exopolysaccharide biosynthesis